jgi:hypothetical protein
MHRVALQHLCRELGFEPKDVTRIEMYPNKVVVNVPVHDEQGRLQAVDGELVVDLVEVPITFEPLEEDTPVFHETVGYVCMTPTFPCSMDTALDLVSQGLR